MSFIDPEINELIISQSGQNEYVLWTGRSISSFSFKDIFPIIFGLVWTALAAHGTYSTWTKKAPIFGVVIGGIFIVFGIYLTFGRLINAFIKDKYAITNQRIITISGLSKSLRSINLTDIRGVDYIEKDFITGSIVLLKKAGRKVKFNNIENSRIAYDILVSYSRNMKTEITEEDNEVYDEDEFYDDNMYEEL